MREFDAQLLRLKQALKVSADQAVAAALGMTKAAFSDRKKRGAFPREKLYELAAQRPDLALDVHYVLTGEHQELNRRLEILKIASQKAAGLDLPPAYGLALQEVLFSVEMEDRDGVIRAFDSVKARNPSRSTKVKG